MQAYHKLFKRVLYWNSSFFKLDNCGYNAEEQEQVIGCVQNYLYSKPTKATKSKSSKAPVYTIEDLDKGTSISNDSLIWGR